MNMNYIVKNPYVNGYCEKCIFHYLDDKEDVPKCKGITYCGINVICGAIAQCSKFKEK